MEKLFFPHFGFGLKTISHFRSACKNQREISSDKVGRLLWFLGGKYTGKGEMVYGEGEMQYRVKIEFTDPKLVSLDPSLGPITKFLKNVQKCGKNIEKIIFPTFCCLIQKLDHNSSLHAKNQREISSYKVRRLLWP